MNDNWYYGRREERLGPVSIEELRELIASDQLRADDLVCREGLDEWTPAGQVRGLFLPPPFPPMSTTKAALPSRRNVAGIAAVCVVVLIVVGCTIKLVQLYEAAEAEKAKLELKHNNDVAALRAKAEAENKRISGITNAADDRNASKDEGRATQNEQPSADSVLEVRVLKVYQLSSFTCMDIEVRNKSNRFLSYLLTGVSLYGKDHSYLGHSSGGVSNLRPGKTAIDQIFLNDIRASEVASWDLSLEDVTIDLGGSNTKYDAIQAFSLKEVR